MPEAPHLVLQTNIWLILCGLIVAFNPKIDHLKTNQI